MDGQLKLSEFLNDCIDYKIKPLIYSKSLTCFKTVCPYCFEQGLAFGAADQ